jgi:hypothetical protein
MIRKLETLQSTENYGITYLKDVLVLIFKNYPTRTVDNNKGFGQFFDWLLSFLNQNHIKTFYVTILTPLNIVCQNYAYQFIIT